MWSFGAIVLLALVAAPMLLGITAFLLRGRADRPVGRLGVLAASAGFVLATWLALRIGTGGDVEPVGRGVLALAADQVAVVLLLLVFGVSAVVQQFAMRYLAGDPRAGWFTGGANVLTGASAGLATADTLVTVAIAWTVAGLALCLLLGTYWHLPAARDGVRRAAISFAVGDLALWMAVAMVAAGSGSVSLDETTQATGLAAAVIGLLIVIAALSRSAQIPFHRWLPATLAAPTPVSALLHAGVVNGGGILLIRLSPLSTADIAVAVTLAVGVASMLYGTLVSLVKPDVKGALTYSTMAQMGFMMLTIGLGLWAAAVIHLVAHGFYKATLFLSSGSAIAHRRRMAAVPPVSPPTGRRRIALLAAAALLPAAALAAATLVVPGVSDHTSGLALLMFAWVTGAAATWGWLVRRPRLGSVPAAALLLGLAAIAYLGVVSAVTTFLAPALPPEPLSAQAVTLITATALAMLAGLAVLRRAPNWSGLHRGLYAHALDAGYLDPQPMGARL